VYHRPQTTCLIPCHSQCITDHLSYTLSLPMYHRPLVLYLVTLSVSQTTWLIPCHSQCITDHLSYTLLVPVYHRPQTTCLIPCHSWCIIDHFSHPALSCAVTSSSCSCTWNTLSIVPSTNHFHVLFMMQCNSNIIIYSNTTVQVKV